MPLEEYRKRRERWLLIKHRDEHADASWDIERPELARSVLTGRTLQEVHEGRPGTTSSLRGAIRRAGKKQANERS
jgi:hypothetical protein